MTKTREFVIVTATVVAVLIVVTLFAQPVSAAKGGKPQTEPTPIYGVLTVVDADGTPIGQAQEQYATTTRTYTLADGQAYQFDLLHEHNGNLYVPVGPGNSSSVVYYDSPNCTGNAYIYQYSTPDMPIMESMVREGVIYGPVIQDVTAVGTASYWHESSGLGQCYNDYITKNYMRPAIQLLDTNNHPRPWRLEITLAM